MRKQEIIDKTNETLARLLENGKHMQYSALGEARQAYEIAIRHLESAKHFVKAMLEKSDSYLEDSGHVGAMDFERYAVQLAESSKEVESTYKALYTILSIVD